MSISHESAREFSERGAAISLAVNAQRALGECTPAANELSDRAGSVPMNSIRAVNVCNYNSPQGRFIDGFMKGIGTTGRDSRL